MSLKFVSKLGGPSFAKLALVVVFGLLALVGAAAALRSKVELSPREKLESIVQERVRLNQELARFLEGVNDEAAARTASTRAIEKIQGIAANLRRIKDSQGLPAVINDLKRQYQAPQEQAEQQLARQLIRISTIPGAWKALNIQPALEELGREETSLAGKPRLEAPTPAPPAARPEPSGLVENVP